MLFGYSYVLSA